MENPIKMDDLGGYHYFRKHPCRKSLKHPLEWLWCHTGTFFQKFSSSEAIHTVIHAICKISWILLVIYENNNCNKNHLHFQCRTYKYIYKWRNFQPAMGKWLEWIMGGRDVSASFLLIGQVLVANLDLWPTWPIGVFIETVGFAPGWWVEPTINGTPKKHRKKNIIHRLTFTAFWSPPPWWRHVGSHGFVGKALVISWRENGLKSAERNNPMKTKPGIHHICI